MGRGECGGGRLQPALRRGSGFVCSSCGLACGFVTRCRAVSCFVLFVFLLLCSEWILSIIVISSYEKRGYFAFLWFVACILSILVCLLFLLAS